MVDTDTFMIPSKASIAISKAVISGVNILRMQAVLARVFVRVCLLQCSVDAWRKQHSKSAKSPLHLVAIALDRAKSRVHIPFRAVPRKNCLMRLEVSRTAPAPDFSGWEGHWPGAGRRVPGDVLMATVSLTVNGKAVTANVDPRTLLVQLLRENLRLTGTHVGCDTSQCGACVVHLDGKAVKSCTMLAVSCDGSHVMTIEGLANGTELHPMQAAFREHHGLQCGFCTPGMIMTAVDIVNRKGSTLDEHTIREELEGNICRCTGYHNIVKAVEAGAAAMAGGGA